MKIVTNVAIGSCPSETASGERVARDYYAIKSGIGYRRLDDRMLVRVTGDDRVSFLHGMCTADIKGMRIGQVAYALFVTERAHVIADFFIYALPDAFLIEIGCTEWPHVRTHLEKFLVADDVEIEELVTLAVIDVEGPSAAAMIGNNDGAHSAPELWHFDPERMIASIPRVGLSAFTILAESNAISGILQSFSTRGAVELSAEALEIVRIEQGIARIGVDTTDKTLALEARLEPAISLSKGCYIGQETLERATARGGIKRRLYGLRIALDHQVSPGATITLNEKPIGILTSIAQSLEFGAIGLSILHHSAWQEGTRVKLHDEIGVVEACVTNLPFKNS